VPSITVLLICPPSVEPKELSFARLPIGEKDGVGAVDRLRELWINFSATDFTETVTVFGESIKRRVDFEKTLLKCFVTADQATTNSGTIYRSARHMSDSGKVRTHPRSPPRQPPPHA